LVGLNRYVLPTPAARAASNASVPKMSETKATRREVSFILVRASAMAGTERAVSSDMRVSMVALRGRSERSTGGRRSEVMPGGREARKARCVVEAVEAKVRRAAGKPSSHAPFAMLAVCLSVFARWSLLGSWCP
jgi:hypothetical protein